MRCQPEYIHFLAWLIIKKLYNCVHLKIIFIVFISFKFCFLHLWIESRHFFIYKIML